MVILKMIVTLLFLKLIVSNLKLQPIWLVCSEEKNRQETQKLSIF